MSMITSEVPENKIAFHIPSINITSFKMNDVLHKALLEYKHELSNNIIVRCESLPVIEGDEKDFERFFSILFSTIFSSSNLANKQFLYVNCDEKDEVIDSKIFNTRKIYSIQLKTNKSIESIFEIASPEKIEELNQIIYLHQGQLEWKPLSGSGCLINLTIPGNLS